MVLAEFLVNAPYLAGLQWRSQPSFFGEDQNV